MVKLHQSQSLVSSLLAAALALGSGCATAPAERRAGQGFQDCPRCPAMVVVPAGRSLLGAGADEQSSEGVTPAMAAIELPPHEFALAKPVAISRFEITRGEYAAFRKAEPAGGQSGCETFDVATQRWVSRADRAWRNPGFEQSDRHPVVCVSWHDAQSYVAWLTKVTGHRYRLLTEAEWEYSARAGSRTIRYWGNGRDAACHYANVSDQTRAAAQHLNGRDPELIFQCRDCAVQTSTVGRQAANAFGLYDMHGNVWEWMQDCPQSDCTRHVNRGGSWVNSPKYLRSAARHADVTDMRNDVLGLRVARDLD